jgi:uncharacterized protein
MEEEETKTHKKSPERRCLITGESKEKSHLLRFVIGPENEMVPDLTHKLPGRGYWVTADRLSLETALKKKVFSRAARQNVKATDNLVDLVVNGQKNRCLQLISLARKASVLIEGTEKVGQGIKKGRVKMLILALDLSDNSRARLVKGDDKFGVSDIFSSEELGSVFGKDQVKAIATEYADWAKRLGFELERLAKLIGMPE